MQAFKEFLSNFPNFSEELFSELSAHLKPLKLEAGDHFLEQGKISKNLAFIESGLIRLYYTNDGKEITYCFCKENNITTSYQSLVNQTASEIAIEAIEETHLQVFSYESVQALYEEDPFWQQLGRLTLENEYLLTDRHNRLIRDHSATDRYRHVIENDGALINRVPLKHLATYLQIAPETLSRIRNKIKHT